MSQVRSTSLARGSVAAAAVLATSWALVGSGLVALLLRAEAPVDADFRVFDEFFWPDVLVVTMYGPLSALVLRRSRHPVGWVLAAVAIGFALSAASIQWSALGVAEPGVVGHGLWVRGAAVGWLGGVLAVALILPWMWAWPTLSRVARWGAAVGLALTVMATTARLLIQAPGAPANPLAAWADVAAWAQRIDDALVPVYVAYALLGICFLLARRARASRAERMGLGWLVASLLLVSVSYLGFEVGLSVGGLWLALSTPALLAAHLMLATAVLVMVVRDPRWGLDLAVSRAAVWGLLTVLVVAVYLAGMWLAALALPLSQDQRGVLVAAVLALAVSPVRAWVQRAVDRLIYGAATTPEILLAQLSDELALQRTEQSSLDTLTDVLRTSMRLGYVGVTSAAAHEATSSSAGRRGEHPVRVLLRHQGRDVGVMEVEPLHGERLDPRTLRVLNQLSGLVAIALQLAQVNRDLDSARTRIVQVRNEERRLLRRELHDGLGPALAGASLALVAVRNNNPTMRAQDIDLLERVAHELSGRAADMRGVARAILPPALDEGRLDEALNMLASVFAHDRFDVVVRAHDVDQLETERQIAIYHIAAEALMNAFKHGKASVCTITMTATSTTGVDLRVHDDGRGIQPGDVPGIGLRSMRERAHELGGTLSVDSDSSGTTIKVVLP